MFSQSQGRSQRERKTGAKHLNPETLQSDSKATQNQVVTSWVPPKSDSKVTPKMTFWHQKRDFRVTLGVKNWKGAKGIPTKGIGKNCWKSWISGYFQGGCRIFSGYFREFQGIFRAFSGCFSLCPFRARYALSGYALSGYGLWTLQNEDEACEHVCLSWTQAPRGPCEMTSGTVDSRVSKGGGALVRGGEISIIGIARAHQLQYPLAQNYNLRKIILK